MSLTRRQFFQLGIVATALTGCSWLTEPAAQADPLARVYWHGAYPQVDEDPALHLLRRASFGEGSDGATYEGDAPVTLTLDRLIVSEGITLTTFSADLDRKNGMQGTFRALVNGGPSINGVVALL